MSLHSSKRAQQRGIPPMIEMWLDIYGHYEYNGQGIVTIHFDKQSRRAIEKEMGREPLRRFAEWLDAYKIVDNCRGTTITLGHRYKRIKRK